MKERFCKIIENFCIALAAFVQTITQPTTMTTSIIKQKKKRTVKFDQYVTTVEEFNNLIHQITNLLKEIILSLNKLFIYKNMDQLLEFLDNLKEFLTFLINENVFPRLNEFKEEFEQRHDRGVHLVEKVREVKSIIFKLFNISLHITTIFIPELSPVYELSRALENEVDTALDNKVVEYNNRKINFDEIIKNLLDLELRSQIIISLNVNAVINCLDDKNTHELLITIEKIQADYIEIMQLSLYLKAEIDNYKKKKTGLLYTIRNVLKA